MRFIDHVVDKPRCCSETRGNRLVHRWSVVARRMKLTPGFSALAAQSSFIHFRRQINDDQASIPASSASPGTVRHHSDRSDCNSPSARSASSLSLLRKSRRQRQRPSECPDRLQRPLSRPSGCAGPSAIRNPENGMPSFESRPTRGRQRLHASSGEVS